MHDIDWKSKTPTSVHNSNSKRYQVEIWTRNIYEVFNQACG
jgi:hypothetical protein